MSTLIVNTLKSSTGINTMTVNDLNLGGVKAWVRWNSSSGSPVIIDDYNIISGSDDAVGHVTWTFEKPFRNAYYTFSGMTGNNPQTSTTGGVHGMVHNGVQTVSQFGTRALQDSSTSSSVNFIAEDNAYNGCAWVGISTGSYLTYKRDRA